MFNLLYMLRYHFSGDNILSNGKIILDTLGGSLLSFQKHKLPQKSSHLWTFISFWTFIFQIKKKEIYHFGPSK